MTIRREPGASPSGTTRPRRSGRFRVPASGRRPDVACISTRLARLRCRARSTGCVPTPGSSPERQRSSATSSPATISCASTLRSTAARRAASGPSGVVSRNCVTPASSARCGTPRWRRSGSVCLASGLRQAPAGVRPSCSATRAPAARTSSSQRCGRVGRADRAYPASAGQAGSLLVSTRVTGPSLTRSTSMWAPNRPVSTWRPSARRPATKAS